MSRREILIKEIEENIEENRNAMVKAAFYSDPEVSELVLELYKRWELNNYRGAPLDYASLNELEFLALKARYYKDHPMPPLKVGLGSKEDMTMVTRPRSRIRSWFRNLIRMMIGI